jgi:hypothetical protein
VRRSRWLESVALASALAIIAGCAARAPEPAQPSTEAEPSRQPMSELDALEHDLDVAARRLAEQLDKKQREPVTSERRDAEKAPPPPPPPAPPPGSKPRPEPPADAPGAGEATGSDTEASARVGSACDVACRALASMKRSAARICALAGDSHERCVRARAKVAEAERRVSGAACECRQGEQSISQATTRGILRPTSQVAPAIEP